MLFHVKKKKVLVLISMILVLYLLGIRLDIITLPLIYRPCPSWLLSFSSINLLTELISVIGCCFQTNIALVSHTSANNIWKRHVVNNAFEFHNFLTALLQPNVCETSYYNTICLFSGLLILYLPEPNYCTNIIIILHLATGLYQTWFTETHTQTQHTWTCLDTLPPCVFDLLTRSEWGDLQGSNTHTKTNPSVCWTYWPQDSNKADHTLLLYHYFLHFSVSSLLSTIYSHRNTGTCCEGFPPHVGQFASV